MSGLSNIRIHAKAAFFAAIALVFALAAGGARAEEPGVPRLGVSLRDLSPEAVAGRGVPFPGGLEVGAVFDGSPAKSAGLLPGDIIVMVEGLMVRDTVALKESMARANPGAPVQFSVMRGNRLVNLPVMLRGAPPAGHPDMPEARQGGAPCTQAAGAPKSWLGVNTASLAPWEAEELRLEQPGGAKVVSVMKGSPAEETGLRPGDVITGLDSWTVMDSRALTAYLASRQPGTRVTLSAVREGRARQVAVTLGKRPEAGDAPKVAEVEPPPAPLAKPVEAEKRPQAASEPEAEPRAPQPAGGQDQAGSATVQQHPGTPEGSGAVGTAKRQASPRAPANAGAIMSVAVSPDGRLVLTGSSHVVKLWEIATRKELRSFKCGTGEVSSVAFSPDGRFALAGAGYSGAKLWDAATGKEVHSFGRGDDGVRTVAFSPDGRSILSGTYDGLIELWDAASGKQLGEIPGHSQEITSVAFSPSGRLAISGGLDETVVIWDAARGEVLHSMKGHSEQVRSVAFSPDSRLAVSASWDGTIRLWDVRSGSQKRTFEGRLTRGEKELFNAAQFSPDGRQIVSAGISGWVQVWDVETGKELRSFKGKAEGISAMALSADGKFAVAGGLVGQSMDETLKLWDVTAGTELSSLGCGDDPGNCASSGRPFRRLGGLGQDAEAAGNSQGQRAGSSQGAPL